jgi:uncharacterized alkaline shock family protein YloU
MTKETSSKKHVIEETKHGSGEVAGVIHMAEDVVATIAGLAARQIPGIHSLGKSRIISFGDKPTKGVGVEVGSKEAALDLDIIVEYGFDIRKVAGELRHRIATEVDRMAGRKVVEINLNVVDIKLPEEEKEEAAPPAERPRVQ